MKKIFLTLLFAITLFAGALPAQAAINALGYTFETTFISGGKTYYVDIAKPSSITKGSDEMTNGTYDLRAHVGFYGSKDDIFSAAFIDNVFNAVIIKIKETGSSTYLGEIEPYTIEEGYPTSDTHAVAYLKLSSASGFGFVNPGNYTIDTFLDNKIIKSVTICLPTFTSSIGKSIGNVTCAGTPPVDSQTDSTPTPASTNPTTPTNKEPTPETSTPSNNDPEPSNSEPTPETSTPSNNDPEPSNSEPKADAPTNPTPVVPNQFSSGVNDACSGGDCYSLFSGFADALGNKLSSIKDADSLSGLINAIVAFGIGLGGVLAVAMIMYQGFLYMKSDNVTTLTAIKGKIINTILGFLLLLTIYTILRTINPDLLNLDTRIDAASLLTVPDRSNDAVFQKEIADLGGKEVSVNPADYNDPVFVGYLYHQQGEGGAPSILWAAQKGLSQVPKETPFIKPSKSGDATIVNRNMRNNINISDMKNLIGTDELTPANFLNYWAKKVGAVKNKTVSIPPDILNAVTQAAADTNNSVSTLKLMCILESSCNRPAADKGNGQGYFGLFQVSNAVFAKHGPKKGTILDYYANSVAGGNYLKANTAAYAKDIKRIQ